MRFLKKIFLVIFLLISSCINLDIKEEIKQNSNQFEIINNIITDSTDVKIIIENNTNNINLIIDSCYINNKNLINKKTILKPTEIYQQITKKINIMERRYVKIYGGISIDSTNICENVIIYAPYNIHYINNYLEIKTMMKENNDWYYYYKNNKIPLIKTIEFDASVSNWIEYNSYITINN